MGRQDPPPPPPPEKEDGGRWEELAYADDAVIIQVDDGQVTPEGTGHRISSSASMPTVVAQMLAHLRGPAGCAGAGDRDRHRLPPAAPFDRVLSTAAVQQVPYDWVDQTRPGGLVITPWGTDYYNGGLLALSVTEERTAVGSIIGKARFMTLRQQRFARPGLTLTEDDDTQAVRSTTDVHPAEIANGHVAFDACIALAIRVPHCAMRGKTSTSWPGDAGRRAGRRSGLLTQLAERLATLSPDGCQPLTASP